MSDKPETTENKSGKWLTTFNDMVTLLLTFFVLLLSMSKVDAGKVQQISRSVSDAFGMLNCSQGKNVEVFDPFVELRGIRIIKAEKKTDRIGKELNDIKGLESKTVEEGVLVTLGEKILFRSGTAQLVIRDADVFESLGSILKRASCPIRVEGHTDNITIHNGEYPSNWELSAARAVAVVKYLINKCGIVPERLSAVGYADLRPRVPNDSENNRALNRRVDLVLTLED